MKDKNNREVFSPEEQAKRRERVLMRQKLLKDDCYRKYDRLTRSQKAHDFISNFDKMRPKRIQHPQPVSVENTSESNSEYNSDNLTTETNNSISIEKEQTAPKTDAKPFETLPGLNDYLAQLNNEGKTADNYFSTEHNVAKQMDDYNLNYSSEDSLYVKTSGESMADADEMYDVDDKEEFDDTQSEVLPWVLSFLIFGLLLLQAALVTMLYISKNISMPEIYFYASCSLLTLSLLTIFRLLKNKSRIFIYIGLLLTIISYCSFTAFSILRLLDRI